MIKQLQVLLCALFLMSCNQKLPTQNNKISKVEDRNFAQELIDNGYLEYADSSKMETFKTQLLNSFAIYDEENYKIVHIDAEALAEFNFDFFLPNLNKILFKRNIQLSVYKLSNNSNSLEVVINGDTLELYTQNELDDFTFWDTAPRNFFKKVNTILKEKKCNEQFYLLYNGNDLNTMLLTEKQFVIISDYYKDNENEKPYKPY